MKALILAAGYATRLYPLTRDYPKPLLKVKGRPIIDYIIDKLNRIERIDEIFVVTNSRFLLKFKNWQRRLHITKGVKIVDDLTKSNLDRRGAIADMQFAIEQGAIDDDLLVIGGDNLFDTPLNDFLFFVQEKAHNPVIGVYDIKDKLKAGKYGVVKLDKDNRIVYFKEKPLEPASTLIAMCLYYFPKDKMRFISEYLNENKARPDATGLYINWLRSKVAVYAFIFQGRWFDIGDYRFYHAAKNSFAE